MTSVRTRTGRHSHRRETAPWLAVVKGLGAAMLVTLAGVTVFALLMQWLRPSDEAVRIFNQVLKLASIAVGVRAAIGRGAGQALRGAVIGLAYMLVGVAMYALLSGQQAPLSSYLADLGMGLAGGGIVGMLMGKQSK